MLGSCHLSRPGAEIRQISSCYDDFMKLITAEVVDGKTSVPPEIDEGSRVAILAVDNGEPVTLSAKEEEELGAAMAQIDSGQYVDGWTLLEASGISKR